jgi:hypothetical protein
VEKRLTEPENIRAAEDIRQLKNVWCAALDNQDWETLGGLFTADAMVSNSFIEGEPPEMPASRFCAWLAATPGELRSMHHLHNFQAEFTSDTEATGRWEVIKFVWYAAAGHSPCVRRIEWGRYHDVYRQTAHGWRIASFRFDLRHATEDHDQVSQTSLPGAPL